MAQLQKGTTYITGDQVTAANLNALVDSGILTPGAVTDQTAKTVPLAADTILLHSAADTALRKTTMTQLFATPQPLGATTPSSVAATTGTFSSTLGVTGVATLGNGAVLGTPASGNLASCTGYVGTSALVTVGALNSGSITSGFGSIDVGADAISGGAISGTTVAATKGSSGTVLNLLSGNSANYVDISIGRTAQEWFFGLSAAANNYATGTVAGDLVLGASGAANLFFGINNSVVGKFTSTGLNSTPIGATTPSTGAFTTVSATSTSATQALFSGFDSVGGANTQNGSISLGTNSVAQGILHYHASSGNTVLYVDNSYDNAAAAVTIRTRTTGTPVSVAAFTSSGAAITGTLSATGQISGTANGSAFSFTPTTQSSSSYITWNNTGGTSYLGVESSAGGNIITGSTAYGLSLCSATSRDLFLGVNAGTKIAQLSTTGLAVTGALSATSTLDLSMTNPMIRASTSSTQLGLQVFDGSAYHTTLGVYKNAINVFFLGSGAAGLTMIDESNASGANNINFVNSSYVTIGNITRITTTNAISYNTTSDSRLKENFRDFTDSGRLIDALKPRVFDWKGDTNGDGKNVIGFVAQEEHAADPIFAHIGAVSVGDDDPTIITKQWQRSDSALIPILVAELQSLRKRLAALESK